MAKIKYCFLFLVCSLYVSAYSGNKKRLVELDALIDKRESFENQKKERIAFLKELAGSEDSPERKYDLNYRIIEEYEGFQSDSAILYIERGQELALRNRNQDQWLENRFQYVFVCAQSGLLTEALIVLDSLQAYYPEMDNFQKATYYILSERLFMNLREYSEYSHLEPFYLSKEKDYNDSILVYLDQTVPLYNYHLFKKLYMEERLDEALQSITTYLQQIDSLSNDGARGYYQLSLFYRKKGDRGNEEKALIQSVMADEQSAVRQNRSLRVLAQLLYEQGDIKRAYRYMQVSLADANFYNTRLRNSQVAEAFPIIEKDYQQERDKQERRLRFGLIVISALFIVLCITAFYARRKRLQLALARKELISQNEDLNRVNEQMKQRTEELYHLTEELQESDQIKEKYVGHFLQLCSMYILKIGEYRKMVNRKIKTGQVEDLYKITSSSQYIQDESREFYQKFDKAFLDIFPNFVDDFNRLLKEDQRFILKKGELLNTELRIFALIRLGIKDSSQIADFLGYNPVTVYSYRTKVKSKAINKDTFHEEIISIKRKV